MRWWLLEIKQSTNTTTYVISQVKVVQYNNRLHMTQCFINFSKHSIISDTANGLMILIQTTRLAVT